MAVDSESQEALKRLRSLIADVTNDPSVMELDASDETDAQTIMALGALVAAMKGGGDVTIETEDHDGHVEAVSLVAMGQDASGEPVAVLTVSSNDGGVSPELSPLLH